MGIGGVVRASLLEEGHLSDTTVRDFDMKDVKAWYPISCLLVAVIYTGSKSLVR